MKICNKCQISQNIDNYYKDKSRPDGYEYVCKTCAKTKKEIYKNNHYEELRKKSLEYSRRPEIKLKTRARKKDRLKIDTNYRMSENIRRRINAAFKGHNKSKSTISILGCSIEYLKYHLSIKFQQGMNWGNYGINGWHIDHIIPLSSAKTTKDIEALCHYSNLQPLWAIDNLQKSNKIKV